MITEDILKETTHLRKWLYHPVRRKVLKIEAIENLSGISCRQLSNWFYDKKQEFPNDKLSKIIGVLSVFGYEPVVNTDIEIIQQEVLKEYSITMDVFTRKSRAGVCALPRQIAMFFAKELTPLSFPKIGMNICEKNHATVLWGIKTIQNRIDTEPAFAARIEKIRAAIKARIKSDKPTLST